MNLIADEGLERVVVEHLRGEGHTVGWVAELSPSISDEEVLRLFRQRDSARVAACDWPATPLASSLNGYILVAGLITQTNPKYPK